MRPPADTTRRPLSFVVDGGAGVDVGRKRADAAFKTIAACEAVIPGRLEHDVFVDLTGADSFVLPDFRPRTYAGGQIWIRARPRAQDVLQPSTPAGTISPANAGTIKGVFSTDQFTDAFVHMLGGAAAGDFRMVKGTSTTDITPVRNFTQPVAGGDLYEVVAPSVTLDVTARPIVHGALGTGPGLESLPFRPTINFENVRFGGGALGIVGRVGLWRCTTDAVTLLLLAESTVSQFLLGLDGIVQHLSLGLSGYGAQRVYPTLASKAYLGAGLAHHYAEEPEGGGFWGYVNSDHGLYIRGGFAELHGGYIRGDHFTVEGPQTRVQLGTDPTGVLHVNTGQSATMRVWKRAYAELFKCLIDGTGLNVGVLVEHGSTLDVVGGHASVQIAGGQYGVWSRYGGSKVLLHEGSPAITGGSAAYAVGVGPTTAASVPNVGDVLAPGSNDDGSRIVRVE